MIPKRLIDEITKWMTERRYGSIQVNFQDGKIVNVNTVQSLKVEAIGVVTSTQASISQSL